MTVDNYCFVWVTEVFEIINFILDSNLKKDPNQIYEEEFEIYDRNETKINCSLMKLIKLIKIFSLLLFISTAFS
jgi:hypothetical protein